VTPLERELLWLRRVRDHCHALATNSHDERLSAWILDAAIELTEAQRGYLVEVRGRTGAEGYRLNVAVARGFDQGELARDPNHISRTVVSRVLDRGGERGLVTTSEEDRSVMDASSVQAQRVLSIISVPLRLGGELRGVLYLDHHRRVGAFSEADLPLLQTFADQAALALDMSESPPSGGALGLWGECQAIQALAARIPRVARSDEPVLIQGESGSGKELVAREVHRLSRGDAPFLSLSCAAVSENLIESELFGHCKGAFTGALRDHPGMFRQAGDGTLVLDEVGEASPGLQAKILRVLQEREVRPLGTHTTLPVSCRIVATTQRNLEDLVRQGLFRGDLFYRLDVLRLVVPSLRERSEDLPLLVREILRREGAALEVSGPALKLLQSYVWPGNVRELENELRRLSLIGKRVVGVNALSPAIREGRGVSRGQLAGKTLEEVELDMVVAALEACGGNKARAARQLGIPRSSLYNLLDRFGLR
jgi:transcriptional regulator with GAF, ATPase, and Fis domain